MILGIFAHPDDELIFGWPVMQEGERAILNISDNHNSYSGAWNALKEVCRKDNILLLPTVGLANEFYRWPTRFEKPVLMDAVKKINEAISEAIDKVKPDQVFTHNRWGEYGHGDHRLIHDIVIRHPDVEFMWCSDICQFNKTHISTHHVPGRMKQLNPVKMHCKLDMSWYNRNKSIYEKHNAWSWKGHEVVTDCQVYSA